MTTYTTIEHRALTYYRADLDRIPPLTREEEATLVERLRLARDHTLPLEVVTQAKHRLVEGLQRLVMFLALKQAPRFARQDLEDLIQEASLALLEATDRCAFMRENFSGYASYVIRRAFATVWTQDFPVSLTRDVLLDLARHDRIKGNPLLSADSLETPLGGTDDLLLADTLEAPARLSPEATADPQKAALVESLLAGLPERQGVALRLRFGLDETDGRERSIAEIGARLGMTDSSVRSLIQHALISCRRLAAKQGTVNQPPPPALPRAVRHFGPAYIERMAGNRLAREAKLHETMQAMQQRSERITGNRLAELAHVDKKVARAYARTHRDPAYEALLQERDHHRLAEACAVLEAGGQPITAQALVHLTHIGTRVIGAFLNARVGNAPERLTDAYRRLQARGYKKIGTRRLSRAAQVSEHRAGLFLRAQAALPAD